MVTHRHVESLEPRALLSGWGTADDFQMVPGQGAAARAITTDAAGRVYAAGGGTDGTTTHNFLREKPAGGGAWVTTWDTTTQVLQGNGPSDIVVAPNGDVYLTGINSLYPSQRIVMERPAGQPDFTVVDSAPAGISNGAGLAVDAAGNVYSAGTQYSSVTTKRGTTTSYKWTVRMQAGGSGPFQTIDTFEDATTNSTSAAGVSVVESGPAAGVYVVGERGGGYTGGRWTVRRGVANASGGWTWTTVDSFQLDPANDVSATAVAVAGDAAGHVYVVGSASKFKGGRKTGSNYDEYWTVRKGTTIDGTSWSWSTADAYRMSALSDRGAAASDVCLDPAGGVHVAGSAYDDARVKHGLIRSDTGGGWQMADDFQRAPGKESGASSVAVDPAGTVFAAGYAFNAGGVVHWVVRSRPAPAPVTASPAATFSAVPISSATTNPQMTELAGLSSEDPLLILA